MIKGDAATTSTCLTGQSVLITGATGTFGHAFTRRALDAGASRVIAFSRDELKQSQMKAAFPDERMRFFVGDVRDRERLRLAMQGVGIVVHAAAMKRIEVCEENPAEAIATNTIGTGNVAMAAIDAGVQKAVFLSTDKAPAAHTLYGASKMAAERLWCQSNVYAAGTPTRLSATRYGNVLGSRGSVLDIFRKQAANGDPVTVTDPDMTRFWMHLDEAVDLVLFALANMRGGEIFIPAVPSAPVLSLAKAVAPDSPIEIVGLRSQERLHEILISPDEAPHTYDCGDFYVIEPTNRTWESLPELPHPKVPAGWAFRSDDNPRQLTAEQLRELVAA